MKQYIKLSEWAKMHSLTYQTAYKQFQNNLIPGAKQLPTGTILIEVKGE